MLDNTELNAPFIGHANEDISLTKSLRYHIQGKNKLSTHVISVGSNFFNTPEYSLGHQQQTLSTLLKLFYTLQLIKAYVKSNSPK